MEGLFMLLLLSSLMAIASFLAGSLPLSFSLSQSQLRLISTIGMGVLVGTSLIVIIPEGVDTLYEASGFSDAHARRELIPRKMDVRGMDWAYSLDGIRPLGSLVKRDAQAGDPFNLPGPVISEDLPSEKSTNDPPLTPSEPGVVHALDNDSPSTPSKSSPSSPTSSPPTKPRTPHAWIGLSLTLGFILMYLIDTLSFLTPHPAPTSRSAIYSLSDLSSAPTITTSPASTPPRTLSTTLGLCIHAAADGIALGASSSTTPSLSFIIFLAIMIHKAPAAFGLTSVLLQQGLGKRSARAHLVIFSLAAPVGALVTWAVVRILGGGGGGGGSPGSEEAMRWWTGVLLLFSGGTFL
ncbi:hypothetical protein MMC20_000042 [Loxospora ochrophaea]|nr:hypothetical protein [Loxospora ochrophaea]